MLPSETKFAIEPSRGVVYGHGMPDLNTVLEKLAADFAAAAASAIQHASLEDIASLSRTTTKAAPASRATRAPKSTRGRGRRRRTAADELAARQRPDGGWAQTPDMLSDAYATGLSLSALAMARPDLVRSQAYRRGVEYLMRTREADGSWHVRSRAFGFQPYFESGFPHGHDQFISMAATAWSAMALMPAAEPARMAGR